MTFFLRRPIQDALLASAGVQFQSGVPFPHPLGAMFLAVAVTVYQITVLAARRGPQARCYVFAFTSAAALSVLLGIRSRDQIVSTAAALSLRLNQFDVSVAWSTQLQHRPDKR